MMLAFLAAAAAALNPLVGAWSLERVDAVLVGDGRVVPNEAVDDADHAKGLIVYDPSGWMALQIGAGNRIPDKSGPIGRKRPIPTGSYYAYYGTYAVDIAAHIVRHHIADSMMVPEIGTIAVRHFRIDGDRLTLTSDPVARPEGTRVNRITFRRLAGTPTNTRDTGY